MTDAQRAHQRLIESTPQERITTHTMEGMGEIGVRPTAKKSAWRRKWIAANADKMTNKEMADYLHIHPQSVRDHLISLGLSIRSSKRGRPRRKNGT